MIRIPMCSLAIALLVGCAAHKTHWVNPDKLDPENPPFKNMRGVFYALPQTTIDVDILASRTTYSRGKLADDLLNSTQKKDEFLRRLDIDEKKIPSIGKKLHSYSLNKFDLKTGSAPDPANVFFVEMPGGINQDTSLLLEFTEAGIPTQVKSEIADRTLDNIGQILQSVTGAAAKYTTFAGKQTGVTRVGEIVEEVEDVRAKRADLLAEALVSDLVVLERQILELTKREAKLIGNFLAIKITPWIAKYRIVPKDDQGTYTLLAVTESGSNSGVQTFADMPALYGPPNGWAACGGDKVQIHMSREQPENTLAKAVHGSVGPVNRRQTHGFYYRVPVPAHFVLTYQNEAKAQYSAMVAQFGRVAALPGNFNNTNSTIGATLYTESGALKSVNTLTKAIQPETIARFGTALENAAQSASNVRRARTAERQTKAEELRANIGLANTLLTTALGAAAP